MTAGSVASLVAVEADQGFREGLRVTPTAVGALVGLGVALVAGGISAAFLGPVVETRAWSIPVKEEAP